MSRVGRGLVRRPASADALPPTQTRIDFARAPVALSGTARAALGMPWEDLRPYTRDPIGDLEAGRLEPLLAALYADGGLRPPAPAAVPAMPPPD